MDTSKQLANRLEEILLNGTWVANTNYKMQLVNLEWKIATTSYKSCNSIALLAQHIHYYVAGVITAFKDGKLEIRDKYSFNFPPIGTQKKWDDFLSMFWHDSKILINLISNLPDEKLSDAFIDEKYGTYHRNINGMIEHCYYHLGQITLIKKLLLNK
jgi:Protein of unknown function (DUF1572)